MAFDTRNKYNDRGMFYMRFNRGDIMKEKIITKKRIVLVSLIIILLPFLLIAILKVNQIKTIFSLEKIDDYPLYSMKYYGGYNYDYTILSGLGASVAQMNQNDDSGFMCSSFLAMNEKDEPILCRNLDVSLYKHPITVLKTNAPGKNASISMADLFYLGYNENNPPVKSLSKGAGLMNAPRTTIDGMNEYGLAIVVLSVPFSDSTVDPDKPTIDEVGANRLILDSAKNIEEAIEVLSQYNIQFHNGPAHFMISDASGKSAVIEFIDGEMFTTMNEKPWQVCTNFILAQDIGAKDGEDRYDILEDILEDNEGQLSEEQAMEALSKVKRDARWSIIYNLKTGEVQVVMGMNYDMVYKFDLKMNHE